jgi:hypothetical protein
MSLPILSLLPRLLAIFIRRRKRKRKREGPEKKERQHALLSFCVRFFYPPAEDDRKGHCIMSSRGEKRWERQDGLDARNGCPLYCRD